MEGGALHYLFVHRSGQYLCLNSERTVCRFYAKKWEQQWWSMGNAIPEPILNGTLTKCSEWLKFQLNDSNGTKSINAVRGGESIILVNWFMEVSRFSQYVSLLQQQQKYFLHQFTVFNFFSRNYCSCWKRAPRMDKTFSKKQIFIIFLLIKQKISF